MSKNKMKTQENLLLIQKMYNEGMTFKQIANMFEGISYGTIRNWLIEMGVDIRQKGPKSKINKEDYFDVINTNKKAYWLGYLMADGCVSLYNNQYSLKLHTALDDNILIDTFIKDIDSSNKPYIQEQNKNGKCYKSYSVSLSSKHMVETLISYGITENKSGNEIIPKNIDEKYYPDFIRGYFDGDGCASIDSQNNKRIGFIAPLNVLEDIVSIIGLKNINFLRSQCETEMYYFNTSLQENVKMFYDYIYKDNSCFCLQRKKKRIENMISQYRDN